MRTKTVSTSAGSVSITYPDALAYAFNAMPVVINVPTTTTIRNFAVKVVSPEIGDEFYYSERTISGDGKVNFDVGELVRIQYDELLRRDITGMSLLSQSTKELMSVTNYNNVGGGYTSTSEQFELSRFVRQFTLTIYGGGITGTALLSTNVSVIYGRGSYANELTPDISKIWCGASECMQLIVGQNTRITIPGRSNYLKTVISQLTTSDKYIGIVLKGNISWDNGSVAPMPQYIEVANAPYFGANGVLSSRTQRIEYTSEYVGDNSAYMTFLSPSGDVITLPVKKLSQTTVSEIANSTISGDVASVPDFAKSDLITRRNNTYKITTKYKYSTLLLPQSEIMRVRNIIGSAYVVLTDSTISNVSVRVYPVPASAEISNKDLSSLIFEVELPQLNNVGV